MALDPITAVSEAVGSIFGFADTVAANRGQRKLIEEQLKVTAYMSGEGRYDTQANALIDTIVELRERYDSQLPPTIQTYLGAFFVATILGIIAAKVTK